MAGLSNDSLGSSFRREADNLRKQKSGEPSFKDLVFGTAPTVAKSESLTPIPKNAERAASPTQPPLSALQVQKLLGSGPKSFFARLDTAWGDTVAIANLGRVQSNGEVSATFINKGRFPGTHTCELSITIRVSPAGIKIIEQDRRTSIGGFQLFPLKRD